MLEAIAAAFPKRPIALNDPTTERRGFWRLFLASIGSLFLIAIGLTCIITPLYFAGPGILRDWQISKDVEVFDGDIGNGQCKTNQAVLVDCKVNVSWTKADGARAREELSFTFFDLHFGDYTVQAVRSAASPDLVSVDLAVSTLWNRIIFMALFIGFGLFMLIGGPYRMIMGHPDRRKILALSEVTPRPVEVSVFSDSGGTKFRIVDYIWKDGDKKRGFRTFMKKQAPFLLDASGKEPTALALTADGMKYAFLVDEEMNRLDLTEAEKTAIKRAREKAQASLGGASPVTRR